MLGLLSVIRPFGTCFLQVYDLNCKLQKALGECELATHKSQKMDKENGVS